MQHCDGIQAIGTAQARESIVLTPKVADTIRAIHFDSGDRVRTGQVLVEMSSMTRPPIWLKRAPPTKRRRKKTPPHANLFDRGFASQARLDTVRAAAEAAEARLNAGGSRIAQAHHPRAVRRRCRPPAHGEPPASMCAQVNRSALDDLSAIKLDFDVPETQIGAAARGRNHRCAYGGVSGPQLRGEISNVDNRVDPTTRTVRVRAIPAQSERDDPPGMLMTVEVRSNPRQALGVPEIAVSISRCGAMSIALRQMSAQTVERVRIETGLRSGGMAEVLGGLDAGDRVVTEGVQSVRPGLPVRRAAGSRRRERPCKFGRAR
ncbi:MAG: efflux RND transporter periplasmic adaptor subunit [Hyphomonadaceae bacterium]